MPALSHRLGLWFANLYVIGMCGTIGGAMFFQFGLGEYPCPMCLLQRVFFLLSALGPAWIVQQSRRGTVTTKDYATGFGWAVMTALLGSLVSGAQTLMHIVPPDPGYAGALLGLHLYTWAFITFFAAAFAGGAALFLGAGREIAEPSAAQRRAGTLTMYLLLAVIASNFIACFFLQGLHWNMSGDPTGYVFFGDLGL
ncbi:disulfide bond formation protein B [Nocardia sp. NPDC051832]|uniref:disulfide bond formation protein B n=1 Tax=Nocardia sp. NPDC051832 TaxID=3155673 RepID=UPI00341F42D3